MGILPGADGALEVITQSDPDVCAIPITFLGGGWRIVRCTSKRGFTNAEAMHEMGQLLHELQSSSHELRQSC